MSSLFKKANVPYLIASSLATLTLISSLVLAVTSNIPLPLILALAVLSVLVIVLSCKAIGNNREVGANRDKFAKKEQELENKITLEKGARENVDRQVEKLNSQLNELTQEKQGADEEINKWQSILSEAKESFEHELDVKTNRIVELCRMVNGLEGIINAPYRQEKKPYREQQIKELRCNQIKELHYKRIKEFWHRKISRLREQLQEAESSLAQKNGYIARLEGKINNIKYEESKIEN
ncbi:hypothetical protein HET73_05395 [Wolbachia endosymbiont of Atemnus politus]|uniref:hypothetical protein n=1 Tax=Wolbachia endosymbiont of Atemnus politus TaxID=2682840 RepID=UPI001572A3BC|nr:hypothetical protein [Wolbachia endosymbiont of Atemnus politus]NSM56808.1 hypothetical protein [Wolbachia endosymbiont of Atemnus politus]